MSNKILQIIDEQNSIFIDRHDEIVTSWLAALSRSHSFMLGPPGVAKSMLAEDMTRRITGAEFFSYLMRKDSTTSEIFGPPSLKALEEDRYEFITTNRLPEAHFAFLDEIWKAGSNALNSILTALNERKFDNGGRRDDIPLLSAFAASNELPQGEELGAIFDRFLLRLYVRDLQADSDFRRLLDEKPDLSEPPGNTVSLDEIYKMQEEVRNVDTSRVVDPIVELRATLQSELGVSFSSRRWLQGLSVVQAYAFINGRNEAEITDLECYKWILWDHLDHRNQVIRMISTTVNPLNDKLLSLADMAAEQYDIVKDAIRNDASDITELASEANKKMKDIITDLNELSQEGDDSFESKVNSVIDKCREYNKYIITHGMGITL